MTSSEHDTVRALPLIFLLDHLIALASTRGDRVFLVGGVVRDLVVGRPPADYDLDVVVEGEGTQFSRDFAVKLGGQLREHEAFLTAKITGPFTRPLKEEFQTKPLLEEVDIVTARKERYQKSGALPEVWPASIEEDLYRRDFTINAMAIPLTVYKEIATGGKGASELEPCLLDPMGGLSDVRARVVRILHDRSFTDDPTRLFRAIRYTERLGMTLEAATAQAFESAVSGGVLAGISVRRVWNEVGVALDEDSAPAIVRMFSEKGLMQHHHIFPAAFTGLLFSGIERIWELRGQVGPRCAKEGAQLMILGALIAAGQDRTARDTQAGRALIERARIAHMTAPTSAPVELSDAVAAYGWSGSQTLRDSILARLKGEN